MSSHLLKNRPRRSRLKIYVHQQGKVLGPYNRDEIRRHLVNGEITLSDPVWHDRLETWIAVSDLSSAVTDGERYEMPQPPQSSARTPDSIAAPRVRRRSGTKEKRTPAAPAPQKGWLERLFGTSDNTPPAPASRRKESQRLSSPDSPFSALTEAPFCGFDTTESRELHLFYKTASGRRCTMKVGGVRQLRIQQWTLGEVIETTTLYTEANVPRDLLVRLERDDSADGETITQRYGLAKSGWNLLHLVCRNGCQVFALLDRSAPPPREADFDDDF